MAKSRLIALEWDETEARIVLAAQRGRQLRVEAAERVEIPAEGEVGEVIQQRVRAVLDQHRVGKGECLLAVGRSAVEMKHLSLPPAPDEELPEMVRFQAQREFAAMGDDWPIDFLPLDHDASQPRHVLAAALNPQSAANLQAICEGLGLEAQSIVVRPCGIASLVARQFTLAEDEACLLIDPLEKQMDLAVLRGQSILILRCARADCGASDEAGRNDVMLEVRRTIAAAVNRLRGKRISTIYLCGEGERQQALAARLQQEFDLPVRMFDPFANPQISSSTVAADERSRYAPLLGMLLDAVDRRRPALDFLNPRRKPPATGKRRPFVLAAAVVLALVLLGAGWLWRQMQELNDEIAELQERANSLKELTERSKELQAKVAEIDQWAATDLNWLGELYGLSTALPPSQAVMLTQLRAGGREAGGEIELEGRVKDSETINLVAKSLRDSQHAVAHKLGRQHDGDKYYRWLFKSTVHVRQEAEPSAPARPASPRSIAPSPAERR
jgi:Tfp pilus assembly PilM family ATPase/Tfp pilus assembly protein PilN